MAKVLPETMAEIYPISRITFGSGNEFRRTFAALVGGWWSVAASQGDGFLTVRQ